MFTYVSVIVDDKIQSIYRCELCCVSSYSYSAQRFIDYNLSSTKTITYVNILIY
jgi:hypothetical protein